MTYTRPAPRTYEVIWKSGKSERIQAQQVSWPFGGYDARRRPSRIHFHCEIDGVWTLVLSADEHDISTVRYVPTTSELADANAVAES